MRRESSLLGTWIKRDSIMDMRKTTAREQDSVIRLNTFHTVPLHLGLIPRRSAKVHLKLINLQKIQKTVSLKTHGHVLIVHQSIYRQVKFAVLAKEVNPSHYRYQDKVPPPPLRRYHIHL